MIDGEYLQLRQTTDMLYITAFSNVQFVLMCWSNTKIDRRNFLTRISGIFNQLETEKNRLNRTNHALRVWISETQ